MTTRPQAERSARERKFSLGHDGELDEVFLRNAHVHIERMDDTCYWIGIEPNDGPMVHVNTGVQNGKWFFNVEEDSMDGRDFYVERPRRRAAKPRRGKAKS